MERVIIFKNTVSGEELTLPVTPQSYPMERGRNVERLDMAQSGVIALPGISSLFSETLDIMLPAQLYPFCTAGTVADPQYYLDKFASWSEAGDVCRYIVAGASINVPVLLGPIRWEEKDGTNDVYARLTLYEYRYLDEVVIEQTQNTSRAVESPSALSAAPNTYVVVAGDTLCSIAKEFYGDASLAYKLATVNNIENPNLIYVGQVINLPPLEELQKVADTPVPTATPQPTAPAAPSQSSAPATSAAIGEARTSLMMSPNKVAVSMW